MEQALLINDSGSNDVYAIATEKDGSIRIFGASEAAQEWAEWADSKLQGRGKLADVIPLLDVSFSIDGPKPMTRPMRAQIAQHISKFGESAQNEIVSGRSEKTEKKSAFMDFSSLPTFANAGAPINRTKSAKSKKALVDYKAKAFRHDQALSSMAHDIKGARAAWDPNLGPSGGWRCPVGSRFGGQITDRYARNCGQSITRRIANAITETGERLEESIGDRRKRRLAKKPKGTPKRTRRGITSSGGVPERMDRIADRVDGGWGRRPRGERRAGRVGQRTSRPTSAAKPNGLPERMDRAAREVLEGTFLENRRRRRGSARNREGIPERMDRAANEVLEGTFVENRRRRRQAVAQQAQTKPRAAVTNRPRRNQPGPSRPSRRVNIPEDEAPEVTQRSAMPRISSAPTPRENRFPKEIPGGKAPTADDIADGIERRRAERRLNRRITEARTDQDQQIALRADEQGWIASRVQILEDSIRVGDATSKDPSKGMEDRFQAAQNVAVSRALLEDMEALRKRRGKERAVRRANERAAEKAIADIKLTESDLGSLERRKNAGEIEVQGYVERVLRGDATDDSVKAVRDNYAMMAENEKRIAADRDQDDFDRRMARINQLANEDIVKRFDEAIATLSTRTRPGTYRDMRGWDRAVVGVSNIVDDDERRQFVDDRLASIKAGEKRADRALVGIENDPEKLRETASKAGRAAAAQEEIASDSNRTPEERFAAAVQAAGHEAEREVYKNALERYYALNGEDTPTPERVKELGEAAKDEFFDAFDKRSQRVGEFMRQLYGDGDAPWLAPDRLRADEIMDMWRDPDRQQEVVDWLTQIYELDDFEAKNGVIFNTQLTDATWDDFGTGIKVLGDIRVLDPDPDADEQYVTIGTFERILNPDDGYVYHAAMFLSPSDAPDSLRDSIKNSGFATIFNGHAITWFKGAGFDHSKVTAIDDGPFVWPRLGFVEESSTRRRDMTASMMAQLEAYRAGKKSIIANDRDAAKIQYLLDKVGSNHSDFILALSNRDDKDGVVKDWFRFHPAQFDSGRLAYSDWSFPDDPRTFTGK